MKQISRVLAFVVFGLVSSGSVLAESAAGNGPTGAGFNNSQNFDQIKQRVEQRLQNVISKMQDKLSCVESAQDPQTLRSCLPRRGGHRHAGFGMRQQGGNG